MTERDVSSPMPWVAGLDSEGKRAALPHAPPLWALWDSTGKTWTSTDPARLSPSAGWTQVVDAEGRSR